MNNFQVSPPKEKKSLEDTIVSLRHELKILYESLRDKNDQLIILEKDIRDRDISIRFLTGEFKRLKDQYKNDHQNTEKSSSTTAAATTTPSQTSNQIKPINIETITNDDLLLRLQRDIKERDHIIKDLNNKIIRISENMSTIQRESNLKNEKIQNLQNEIDKFRQVVSYPSRRVQKYLTEHFEVMFSWCFFN